jgi:hypothetical protein
MPGIAFEAAGVAQTQQRHHSFKADHPIQHPQSHHPRASTAPANPPHRDQIPIARGTARPQLPAGSFPGGFRTTAPGASENVAAGPSSETLHKMSRATHFVGTAGLPQEADPPADGRRFRVGPIAAVRGCQALPLHSFNCRPRRGMLSLRPGAVRRLATIRRQPCRRYCAGLRKRL